MSSLIEKIDAEIEKLHEEQRSMHSWIDADRVWIKIDEAEKIKQIILSDQKKPCGFCKNSESIKYHGVTEKLIDGTTITISGDTEATRCPMCGRLLNQPSIDTE